MWWNRDRFIGQKWFIKPLKGTIEKWRTSFNSETGLCCDIAGKNLSPHLPPKSVYSCNVTIADKKMCQLELRVNANVHAESESGKELNNNNKKEAVSLEKVKI